MCGGQRRAAVPLKGTAARRIAKPRTAAQNRAPVAPSRLKNQVCSQTVQILRILFRHLRSVSKSKFAAGIRHAGAGNRAIPFLWICFLYSTVLAVCKDKKRGQLLSCPRSLLKKVECGKLQMCAAVRKKSLCSFSWFFYGCAMRLAYYELSGRGSAPRPAAFEKAGETFMFL